jgi:hypothetical protein
MVMALPAWTLALFAVLGLATPGLASPIAEAGPDRLADTRSLGDLIRGATKPVHILYVHGMMASGAGDSVVFQQSLCRHVAGLCVAGALPAPTRRRLDLGETPPGLTYLDQPIWTAESWAAGAPFVERYRYPARPGLPEVIVDEVNWWPLVFPLKCRALLLPEAGLAGADRKRLNLCAALDAEGRPLPAPYRAWITPAEIAAALARPSPIGGAAWLNGLAKTNLMDWGLSDAVIALGPMRTYLRRTIDEAFAYAEVDDAGQATDDDYVLVAASLGSFIVLDAWSNDAGARRMLDHTAYVYLFANQFALLELARLGQSGPTLALTAETSAAATPAASPMEALRLWSATPRALAAPTVRQVIAFSDPSDALTFRVPALPGAKVVNVYDRNGFDFLGFAADPLAAHVGHAGNSAVLDVMIDGAAAKALKR